MICKHPHGDAVNGYWLCGRCYAKLEERPKWYAVEPGMTAGGGTLPRQVRTQAEVRIADGLTLSQFVGAMSRRVTFLTRGLMHGSDAVDYVIDLLRMQGVEFGHPDYGWDEGSAHEIVGEDTAYWDCDAGRGNGAAASHA